ncbi:hypothetical protein BKA70DRAFT_1219838 [Coprinopsis sp. MPI-PUGE-AT-0042]|nr:hypothetical protein BKA70DRAFT_1219838 [Coprinopsis sp. MPI-PUGE-AT-0042]
MPSLTLEDAKKAMNKKTVTKGTFSHFAIGILEELCRSHQLPVVPTGKRRSQRTTKGDYIAAILASREKNATHEPSATVVEPAFVVPVPRAAPQGPAPVLPPCEQDVQMGEEASDKSVADDMLQDHDISEVPTTTCAMPQDEEIAEILPFAENAEITQEDPEKILVRLYADPRSWNPTIEVTHICDAGGYIDLKRLALELRGPEKSVKVIHPRKLRPIYEYYPGRFPITDAVELMDDGGLRVCFM